MLNPILTNLNQKNNLMQTLMNGGNPESIYKYMMTNNPQFAEFVRLNKNKTPQQIAEAYGINPSIINQFMK